MNEEHEHVARVVRLWPDDSTRHGGGWLFSLSRSDLEAILARGDAPRPPAEPVETLRDKFAMAALAEVASLITVSNPDTINVVAALAYQLADAMLAARTKAPPTPTRD